MEVATIRRKFKAMEPTLTERGRRRWAATEAMALGYGGIALVERATVISRSTIARGIRELEEGEELDPSRVRRAGGGRKRKVDQDRRLTIDLEAWVEPTASGEPQCPLRCTSKSIRKLAQGLSSMGHKVSHTLVGELLHEMGYRLQGQQQAEGGAQPS